MSNKNNEITKKNFNEVLKEREKQQKSNSSSGEMSLDSTERIKVLSPGQLVFKRFVKNKLAIVGTVILLFMFVFSFLVPLVYPYGQTQIFYKYDNSVIDYAMVSERSEYATVLLDKATVIDSSVKNKLTSTITSLKGEGKDSGELEDKNGAIYRLEKNTDSIYSLYESDRELVCTLSGSRKYATYNPIMDDIKYENSDEVYDGFEKALKKAVDDGKTEFKVSGITFSLEKNKKSYNVSIESEGAEYVNGSLGEGFEEALGENLENTSFEYGGDKFVVTNDGDVISVFSLVGETKLAYLTTLVIDRASDDSASEEFKLAAIDGIADSKDFEADGRKYKSEYDDDLNEYSITDKESGELVAVISNMVVRSYSGEDSLGFAFKEKARDVVDDMNDNGIKNSTFNWQIAQVDENGEYSYDENGELIKQDREISVVNKNGNYTMTTKQVVYLIDAFAKPSKEHIAGTDGDGMDLFARMMYGGRVSLLVSFVVIFLEMIIGIIMGGISGFFGGWVDTLIMRIVDIFYCIPDMPVLIILGALFDALKMQPYTRLIWLMVVLGVFGWAGVARLVRGQILSLREQEFMVAAEAIGLNTKRRIFKHLMPNVMPQLIVSATTGLGSVILTESTLSFLGLGVKHPLATWGTMINSVSTAEAMKAYTYIWVPVGLLICLTVIAFNFVGDGLRDAFDPKMKR